MIQRLVINAETGTFRVEYRSRDLSALLVDTEWGWTEKKAEAYVFPEFSKLQVSRPDSYEISAEMHAAELVRGGMEHVHPIVFSQSCAEEMRRRREEDRASTALASARAIAPAEVYAATSRRMGERDA